MLAFTALEVRDKNSVLFIRTYRSLVVFQCFPNAAVSQFSPPPTKVSFRRVVTAFRKRISQDIQQHSTNLIKYFLSLLSHNEYRYISLCLLLLI
jgi:hypothetical protein